MIICLVALCLLLTLLRLRPPRRHRFRRSGSRQVCSDSIAPRRFPQRKPDWARRAVLELYEQTGLSHRKLAHTFNRMHFARSGVAVGRTWVRDLLLAQAHAAVQRQTACKHCRPPPLARNACWGFDTTSLPDTHATPHLVLGLVDHGSRSSVTLRRISRFNHWTLLGHLFLAIGRFGKPAAIRLDNHPVHHARRFKRIMRWAGIRLRFTHPASPWQNGRIERLFGTLKSALHGFALHSTADVDRRMGEFRYHYNRVRPHQHLDGRTPDEAWRGVDPYRRLPRRLSWYEAWDGRLRGWRIEH